MKKENKNQFICPVCGKIHRDQLSKEKLCSKHYYQKLRYGKFLDTSSRSIYDPNEYRVEGNTTYIKVYDKYGNTINKEVIIDTEDVPKILKYKVFIQEKSKNLYYGMCNVNRNVKVPVHKIVTDFINVDHIDGNTLNNKKNNLRESNMTMQNLNKITTKGIQKQIYTYKGKNEIKGYAATLSYNKKRYISKYYKKEEQAKFYRYLLLQLLPFKTNYNSDFIKNLTEEETQEVIKDFKNRFKDRVL